MADKTHTERYQEVYSLAFALGYYSPDGEGKQHFDHLIEELAGLADEGHEEMTGMTCLDAILKQESLPLEV